MSREQHHAAPLHWRQMNTGENIHAEECASLDLSLHFVRGHEAQEKDDTLQSKGAAQSRQNMFKRFLIPPHNLLKHFYCHHSVHLDDISYNLHESPFMEAWLNFTGICSIYTYNYTFAQNCIFLWNGWFPSNTMLLKIQHYNDSTHQECNALHS